MYKTYKNPISIAATVALSMTALSVSAATIKYEIDFFEDDVLIGEGSFSYDDEEKLTCFFVTGYYDCYNDSQLVKTFGDRTLDEISESLLSGYDIFYNVLTDFNANIYTYSTSGTYNQWWADEETGQAPGYIFNSRYGGFINENFWFFGDGFFGTEQFSIDFAKPYDDLVEGSWSLNIVDPPFGLPTVEPGVNYSELGGTFEARRMGTTPSPNPTSVPEPSNIFGALIAMLLGYCAKRKLARAK